MTIQEAIYGFLLDEIINPKGEFHADQRISVGQLDPDRDDDKNQYYLKQLQETTYGWLLAIFFDPKCIIIRSNCNISSVYKYNIYNLCFARYNTNARYEYKYANSYKYEYKLIKTKKEKK